MADQRIDLKTLTEDQLFQQFNISLSNVLQLGSEIIEREPEPQLTAARLAGMLTLYITDGVKAMFDITEMSATLQKETE